MIELEVRTLSCKTKDSQTYQVRGRIGPTHSLLVSWDHHFAAVKPLHYECQRSPVDPYRFSKVVSGFQQYQSERCNGKQIPSTRGC
jgi:hypothetical protein